MKKTQLAALAAGVALAVVGCTPGSVDKAGGTTDAVTVRLANPYGSLTYVPQVTAFVNAAQQVSAGALRVEVVDEWGHFEPGFETKLIGDVARGEIQLGWVGTRAFDLDDRTALRALTAPMLVDSYELQRALLDSELPKDMLAALDSPGVTGLAILAGGLRKPFSVQQPMVSVADFKGKTFQVFESKLNDASVKALGAIPKRTAPGALDAGLVDGSIDGFEKQLSTVLINGTHRIAPYVAANVNLWPETIALIAGEQWLASLSTQQRDWLTRAARVAATASVDTLPKEADTLRALCGLGLRAASATSEQRAELRRAFDPVYAELRRDRTTAGFLDRIERTKASLPETSELVVPTACRGRAPTPSPATGTPSPAPEPSADAKALDGVYRWTLTAEEAKRAGWPEDPRYPFPHVFTMTLRAGRWEHNVRDAIRAADYGGGSYQVEADLLRLAWDDGGATMSFRFTADADGNLTLKPEPGTSIEDAFVIASQRWDRIG